MSLIEYAQPATLGNALLSLASNARTASELGRAAADLARRIRTNLPEIKKEKNQARSTFERKMAPKQSNTITNNNRDVSKQLVDSAVAGSTRGQRNRSMTSSRMVSVNSGSKRNKSRVQKSPYMDKIAVCFRGTQSIVNTGVGVAGIQTSLGISTGVGTTQLNDIITQLTSLAGIYREFRCTKLNIDFVPRVASTVTGGFALCVDRDCRAGTVAAYNTVIRKDPFFEVDLKQAGSLTWLPQDSEDRRFRYTINAGGARPLEFLSHGVVLGFSDNDQAAGVNVGELFYDGWFEFAVPF